MLGFLYALSAGATPPPPHTLVGVIERHGTKACKPGAWDIEFHAQHWQAGWVDLVVDDALVADHKGQIMELSGARTTERPVTEPIPDGLSPDNCPIPQMRSDMVESVDRMRYRRGDEPDLPAFKAFGAKPFEGLVAEPSKDGTKLVFRNTLGVTLEDVALQAHYEGCYGKPGSQRRKATAKSLAPGESLTLEAPLLLLEDEKGPDRKGGRSHNYALAAILVSAVGPSTWVTIDIGASRLGIQVPDCPR
ncbi:MAG: hypothetical protein H6736_04050 [Alphaproteobacteria bacterium]|nr:hypothetical protein [Alphaproteobacteria bacterium]MCB9690966.1 hypothetical protein [Alphaproteobacteria bacterium]